MQWDNYIKQSVVSEAVKLLQLQAACDDALRQRVLDTGTYSSLTTENERASSDSYAQVDSLEKSLEDYATK